MPENDIAILYYSGRKGKVKLFVKNPTNSLTTPQATDIINSNSSWGGGNRTKTDVKLAYKAVFVRFPTSGERPMLLVRLKAD